MFCYNLGLIDFFNGLTPYDEYLERLKSPSIGEFSSDTLADAKHDLFNALHCLACTDSYWEIDIRGKELYVGGFPTEDMDISTHIFYVLKQDNNGSTFMISPFEAPYKSYTFLSRDKECLNRKAYLQILSLVNEYDWGNDSHP